jgi:hypothetical protein
MSLTGPAVVKKAWFTDNLQLQDIRLELEGGIIVDIGVANRQEVLEPEVEVIVEIYGPKKEDQKGESFGLR